MNKVFIFSFFLLFPFLFAHERPKSCGHQYLQKNNKLPPTSKPDRLLATSGYYANATINAENARIASGQKPLFSNLRVTFDYQFFNTSLLNASTMSFFQNTLLSSVQNYYQSTIKLFPRQKTIYPPSAGLCGDPTLVPNQNSLKYGYNNTDVLIYVIGEYNTTENYIAWAMKCTTDPDLFDRPLIGVVNCNFYYLDWNFYGFDSSFKTLAHEMFHFFVFSSDSYNYYVSNDGVTLGLSNVVKAADTTTNPYRYKLILNQTTNYGSSFFNCSGLDGLWLEDGDEGSNGLGSHWEDTYFRDEMMSPIDRINKKMSNFSFNLLGASGWYMVNYNNIQDYYFGYQEGCNFQALGCKNTPLFSEYCAVAASSGCQEDFSGIATCGTNQFTNGICNTEDSDSTNLCFYNSASAFQTVVGNQGGSVSPNSFCFLSTLFSKTLTSGYRYDAACYTAQCGLDSNTNQSTVVITVGSANYTCTSTGQTITDAGYSGNLTCPNISRFCQYYHSHCTNGCNGGMGVCSTGSTCHFFKGQGICSQNCSSCTSNTNCLVCEPGKYIFTNATGNFCSLSACTSKQYLDPDTQACINCDSSCLTCMGNGSSNCTNCPAANYFLNNTCTPCSTFDSLCQTCSVNSTGGNYSCQQCPLSYFVNASSKCELCSNSCLSCNGNNASSCLTCHPGFYLTSNNTCQPCDSLCLTCFGPSENNCSTCVATRYLTVNYSCYYWDCSNLTLCSECQPTLDFSALFCSQCDDGYYLSGTNTCMACNSQCLTCNGSLSTNCLSCNLGTYLSGTSCSNCDVSCKNCTGPSNSSSDCSKCNINYMFNSNNTCERLVCDATCKDCVGKTANDCYDCFDGRFFNLTNNTCDLCSSNCSTCFGAASNECLSCSAGLVLIEGFCKNTSQLGTNDISSTNSLEGLGNITSNLNLSSNNSALVKNYTQTIINQMTNLTSNQSSNLSNDDLSSLGSVMLTICNNSVSNNNTWDPSFTGQAISIIQNVSSSFANLANSTGALNNSTFQNFMSSLFNLQKLNGNSNDTNSKKQNEQALVQAAKTIIDSNIYVLLQNSSLSSISQKTSLCNFQILSISSNTTSNQSISAVSISQNTDGPSLQITPSFLSLISSSNNTVVKVLEWATNPYANSDSSNTTNLSAVVSINFYSSSQNSFTGLSPSNLSQNQTYKLPKNKGEVIGSGYAYSCIFWNTTTSKWDNSGLSTTQPQSSDGSLGCATNHFSDFAFTVVASTSGGSNSTSNSTGNSTTFGGMFRYSWLLIASSLVLTLI